MKTKQCSKCKQAKPECEFYIIKATGKRHSWCKTCCYTSNHKVVEKYKIRNKIVVLCEKESKVCSACKQKKDAALFSVSRRSSSGISSVCRECKNKDTKQRNANRDIVIRESIKARRCISCKIEKRGLEFGINRHYADGLEPECKECHNDKCRRHVANDPQWNYALCRRSQLMQKYNMSIDDFDAMLKSQNGVCAICGKPEMAILNGKAKIISVDHCHKTGKVRGLLCGRCNSMIGYVGEDVDILISAINYIEEHKAS